MDKKTVRVWTLKYEPFIMGGSVYQPVAAEVEHQGEHNLGQGFTGYLVKSPITGKTYVAESTSGAFVGPTVQQVRLDILSCDDISVMKRQVEKAKDQAKGANVIPADEFWKLLK